jgi:2-amino-4-hydroxy-6-hydroxymethyldihydropteridine diphosphokinase
MKAWIGLGSNIGDSAALVARALSGLDDHPEVNVVRHSSNYLSEPWGNTGQDDFVNAVAEIETRLSPPELLGVLLDIETRLGRTRNGERWGPRQIDLDLLDYEGLTLRTPALELPHPLMDQRAFVLVPLLELEPGFSIPGKGKAADFLERLGSITVKRLPGRNAR